MFGAPFLNVRRNSHHVGMVGDDQEVEGAALLDWLATGGSNLLAARQAVRRVVPRRVAK